jgi:glycosyltransferase involved in cell wall biosynthesis
MKIGLFTDAFFPMTDGVGMVVHNYAKYLMNYGEVIVFCPKYHLSFDDGKLPYKVVRCASFKVLGIDYSLPIPDVDLSFIKELDKYKLDIVHIHSPFTMGKVGIRYAKKHHIPVIGSMHSQYKQDFMRATKNKYLASKLTNTILRVYAKCNECWAVSSEVARIYHEDYGFKYLPKVMNNATEMLPVENISKARKYINKECDINNNTLMFLFVGRINNLKNVFFILDVIKRIKELSDLKFKMVYVGEGQDMEELKRRIKKYKLGKDVLLYGKVDDREELSNFYQRADLFIFPSMYDASSIVQIEAASQKTPCIFAKDSATSSMVKNNINGFVEEIDVDKFANRIIKIMNNKELLEKVSNRAYKDLYVTWKQKINDVYKKYEEIIKKGL